MCMRDGTSNWNCAVHSPKCVAPKKTTACDAHRVLRRTQLVAVRS